MKFGAEKEDKYKFDIKISQQRIPNVSIKLPPVNFDTNFILVYVAFYFIFIWLGNFILPNFPQLKKIIKGKKSLGYSLWILAQMIFGLWLIKLTVTFGWNIYFTGTQNKYFDNERNINKMKEDFQTIANSEVEVCMSVQCYKHSKSNHRKGKGPNLFKVHDDSKSLPLTTVDILKPLAPFDPATFFSKRFIFIEYKLTCEWESKEQKKLFEDIFYEFQVENQKGSILKDKFEWRFAQEKDNMIRIAYLKDGDNSGVGKILQMLNYMFLILPATFLLERFVERYRVDVKKIVKLRDDIKQAQFEKQNK